jgi:Transposase DDE domain
MPYKATADRRHKIPKARYRVTNRPEYDQALLRRRRLTFWVTGEPPSAWRAPVSGKRGSQAVYSDVASETGLTLRLVFRQPLRQTEGTMRSIVGLLGVDLAIPDHTWFSRRGGGEGGLRSYQMKRGAEGSCNPTYLHAPTARTRFE